MSGGFGAGNTFYGDAGGDLFDWSHGGNDSHIARGDDDSVFYGDAGGSMFNHAYGGNDQIFTTGEFGLDLLW